MFANLQTLSYFSLFIADETRITSNLVRKVAVLKSKHPQIVEHILNAMGEVAQKASDILQQINSISSSQELREKFQILEVS